MTPSSPSSSIVKPEWPEQSVTPGPREASAGARVERDLEPWSRVECGLESWEGSAGRLPALAQV